jgi:hypothetical protein
MVMKPQLCLTLSKFVLIVSFALFLFSSCNEDSKTSVTPTPSSPTYPVVSGYTLTDLTGNLIGPSDTTDWRTDEVWSQSVQNLFGGVAYDPSCNFEDSITSMNGFPNPTTNFFTIAVSPIEFSTGVYFDSLTKVDLILVNQRHEIIVPKLQITNTIDFSLQSADSIATDTIFRVYYKFTDKNNCVRCGHGDILRN